jgi:hypothetical protein
MVQLLYCFNSICNTYEPTCNNIHRCSTRTSYRKAMASHRSTRMGSMFANPTTFKSIELLGSLIPPGDTKYDTARNDPKIKFTKCSGVLS